MAQDLRPLLSADSDLSALAAGVIGSEILKIAHQIRLLKAEGRKICNLTVGDFDPNYFPIPASLLEGTCRALQAGHTNYPPADGVLPLREAVVRLYERELGLTYPVESVLVTGGARPLLYGAYKTLLDPGDTVVYPVPSWNNNHYAHLSGGKAVELVVKAESNFFPTRDAIHPHLASARMICLNSPLNPTGTVIGEGLLREIALAVVEENARRRRTGARSLYLLFDQVYWTLTFGDTKHATPVGLVPEVAPYTLLLDALSKAFCATGLRVGWGLMPPAVRSRMADILGHVGAWAPKAEQMASAELLDSPELIHTFQRRMKAEVQRRLDALYVGFSAMAADGYAVQAIAPQGAIYLSVRFNLLGRTIQGKTIQTNEDVRRLLLEHAGVAIVPFQAFGLREESGWSRLSVGAVSMDDIHAMFPRLRELLCN
jgi:aspartate aminotransferase